MAGSTGQSGVVVRQWRGQKEGEQGQASGQPEYLIDNAIQSLKYKSK